MTELLDIAVLLGTLFFFSIISFNKKSLDRDGILIANAVGITIFLFGGLLSFLLITIFFIVAEFSTTLARKQIGVPHEQRTVGNIIGNSMAALLALFFLRPDLVPYFAGISAALSDTVSSEIGLTSKKKPVLITTLEEVEPGTDGGITLRGLIAGLLAATLIAIAYYFFVKPQIISLIIIIVSGMIGTLTDSLLGAVFERKKKLNNMHVNFFGSSAGVITAIIMQSFFMF